MTQTPKTIPLVERLGLVRARISDAARRSSRSPEDVTLVAVSKTHPVEVIRDALLAGVTDFGENRVQEAETKIPVIGRKTAKWHLIGLMTLPPFFEKAERVRPYCCRLRELRDELQRSGAFGNRRGELSMGMTNDFEIAIEEGATIVRVGTAIFGERQQLQNREQ